MIDREKVIKGLHDIARKIANTVGHLEAIDYFRTIDEAIALLNEQQEYIHELQHAPSYVPTMQQEIVRCSDCKWYLEEQSWCFNTATPKEQTFFCADGVKKNENC